MRVSLPRKSSENPPAVAGAFRRNTENTPLKRSRKRFCCVRKPRKKKPKTTTPNKTRREAQFPPYRYSRNGGRSGTDPGRAVPRAAPRGRRRSPAGALPPRPPLPQRGPARPPAAAAAAPARRLPPPPAPVAAAAARPGSQGCGRQRP